MINQPQDYDLALGGKAYPLTSLKDLKIKDLEEIKVLLSGGYIERKILALKEALNHGEAGFDLIIQSLNDPAPKVSYTAYQLLSHAHSDYGKKALTNYYQWEHPKIQFLRSLDGHNGKITALAFHYDREIIVSGSTDKTIKIWSLNTGQEFSTLRQHTDTVSTVDISRNGKIFVSGSNDQTIKVWDLEKGSLIGTITENSTAISHLKISPNGQTLISATADQNLKIWNLQTGNLIHTLAGHSSPILDVKVISQDQIIISMDQEHKVKFWNGYNGKEIKTINLENQELCCFDMSANNQYLAFGTKDKTINILNWETEDLILTLTGHNQAINTISFSPGGWGSLVSGSMDKTIKIWSLETGEEIRSLEGHSGGISSVIISPDWQFILSGGEDQTIVIWKLLFDS